MTRRSRPSRLEWLDLLEISGPFLSPPVIERVFPQGLDVLDTDLAAKLRLARDDWADNRRRDLGDPTVHAEWIRLVLAETLGYTPEVLLTTGGLPESMALEVPEYQTVVRPDYVLAESKSTGEPVPRLLVQAYPSEQDLGDPVLGSVWAATPSARMTQLCRATGVRLGLLTNGEQWMLVDAPVGETSAYVSWFASLWGQEPDTLRAFQSLLHARRFFGVAESETLEAMLVESASYQTEVTEQLGAQVRRAIEVLIRALDRADADTGRQLLADTPETELYEAAITVMMRLVFLFFAEENGLLLLGDETYDQFYAASMLRGQLREEADRVGLEVLERRQDAWSRLLATFRAIYGGLEHEALRLLPYGGSLFDPDRFTFLEGRGPSTSWADTEATPLPIDNRTVLHILDALQVLRVGGSTGEARKLSFRALDIEQIGHVYESLLDHIAVRAASPVLGLVGARGGEPEISLDVLETQRSRGDAALVAFLASQTSKSSNSIRRALSRKPTPIAIERIGMACSDHELLERVLPYHALLRDDPWGDPIVGRTGSFFVTAGPERRGTGTYYTPRALTEEIVAHALEPLAYRGPDVGRPRSEWELKGPSELLDLKVCDFAMGSGAFLVQAARWLGERLVESWERAGADDECVTPDGRRATGSSSETIVPSSDEDRRSLARRLIVGRCLYGVDVNPLAVEMAKLSLWLVTLAKDRPFSFLDHALKCGDSLLGVTDLDQVREFHPDPSRGRVVHDNLFDPRPFVEPAIARARDLRRELESLPVMDLRDARNKQALNNEAEVAVDRVRVLADVICAAAFATACGPTGALDTVLDDAARRVTLLEQPDEDGALRDDVEHMLNLALPTGARARRPFHWPLEFPEVFDRSGIGFDALISNPPFMGGVDIAARLGTDYGLFLKNEVPESRGFVDLAVYFHRRAQALVRASGVVGLLGPQSVTTTANRRAGTDAIVASGRAIGWARSRIPWPGTASIIVCAICYFPADWAGVVELNRAKVGMINSALEARLDLSTARRLPAWLEYSEGTHLYGMAFVKSEQAWEPFLAAEPSLSEYLRPFVNADILCSTPDFRSELLAVDFGDRDRAELPGLDCVISHLELEVGRERANQTRQIHETRPWLFWDKRLRAYVAARQRAQILVCPNLSKHLPLVFVNSEYLFAKTVKMLITDDPAIFGLLQSTAFLSWALATSPMRGTSVAFSTRDSLDTFVPPLDIGSLRSFGSALWGERRRMMLDQGIGITHVLNRVNDPDDMSGDVENLRRLQRDLDDAVARTYRWEGLAFDHGFYETPQGVRYTITEEARVRIVESLLVMNQAGYADTGRSGRARQ